MSMEQLDQLASEQNVGTIIPGEMPAVDEAPQNNEVEDRARAMGWRPQDEYKGDPSKWRSAEDFVQRGESELPILRENLRRTTSEITTLRERLAKTEGNAQANFQRLEKMTEVALARQRQTLEAQYAAAMRDAAASGDLQRYDQLQEGQARAIAEFDRTAQPAAAPVQEQPQQKQPDPYQQQTIQTWTQRNAWFEQDMEMRYAATAYSNQIASKTPGMTLEENLAATEQYMRKRYSDKFPQQGNSGVEGAGSRMPASAPRGRGAADLPPEARQAAEKMIRDGLFKDMNDYAKEYFTQ